ncbi:Ribonuclease G [Sinobacterium norvegicum]|uniref:Ribonuclease G n=1 Tax=Sinobacterium norvegicum TaxID=1641715 RepID=A0ABM9ACZ1_9GAMM|nr:ribonuclease G [Sinobacterium norvegicum]CAH0991065.1 Ribonuclease G [Sinobacterium norvegicum]
MSEEILINVTPSETRAAVIENGVLQEVYIERTSSRGIVGNIYCGKVVRVLPGMQAAFVDIGLEKASFIHASDIVGRSEKLSAADKGEELNIRDLVHDGQRLYVQVVKDPLGTKGARVTTQLSVSSRYLVYMPQSDHIGISQRIDDVDERNRLKELVNAGIAVVDSESGQVESDNKSGGGFIVRTVAEGIGEAEILADIQFLKRLWQTLERKMPETKASKPVYEDLPLAIRVLRDMVRSEVERIRIDSTETFQKAAEFCHDFVPDILNKIEHYRGERPIFDLYSVESEIQKGLERKVSLKSGGYLIIDQTEALTTIDVNTGAFVGHRNLEETIFKTNLEAAACLARQLRVRNLGGMIIIDFIDMKDEEHRRQLLRTLNKVLDKDHAKTAISTVSELGLVQMTRKRTRESLEHVLCVSCPACHGRGALKSAETVCYEIFREILREARAYDKSDFLVLAEQSVIDRLLDEDADSVADLAEFIDASIRFQVEAMYNQEQFDVVLL